MLTFIPTYRYRRPQYSIHLNVRILGDEPQNIYQNEIAEVRISSWCIGVRPIVLFVLCTLYLESTKYKTKYKVQSTKSTIFIRIIWTLSKKLLTVRKNCYSQKICVASTKIMYVQYFLTVSNFFLTVCNFLRTVIHMIIAPAYASL